MGSALGTNYSFGASLLYGGLGSLILALVFTGALWLISSRGDPRSRGIPLSYMFVYALVIALIGAASGGVVGQYEGIGMSILISVLIAMGMGVFSVGFYQLAGKSTTTGTGGGSLGLRQPQ